MTSSLIRDLAYGTASENANHIHIQKFLGYDIKMAGGTARLDIVRLSDNVSVGELKSRRVKYNYYPTVYIGLNKIKAFTKDDTNYFCFFKFTDGLYYIKYNKETFDTFDIEEMSRNDEPWKRSKVINIPMNLLTKINNE
jgi:hypothetical protein